MTAEAMNIYDLEDLEKISIPPRSRLYHLAPVGISTPFVESLTSYTTRLAEAHCVTTRRLFIEEIAPRLSSSYFTILQKQGNTVSSFWQKTPTLNGLNAWALDWVQVIEALTGGSKLNWLTMLTWTEVLSSRGLIRQNKAWCPFCYEDWRIAGLQIYDPLLWSLDIITDCPRHHRALQQQCPSAECRRSIAFLESKGRSGHCPHCNTWLGLSADTEFSTCSVREGEELWKEWVTKAIGEMLTAAPTLSRPPTKEHFSHTLEKYIELILKGNTAVLARQLCLHRTTVKDWQNGRQLPQLGSLLKVCHYLGTSPLHLLSKDDVIMPHKFPSLPTKLTATGKNKNTYRPIDDELLRQELEKELTSQDQPPRSKGQILKPLGYNPSTASKHFPELCRKVSARYRAYQKNKRSENMQDMINDIKRATYKVHAQGEYPRIARVSEFLRRPKTVRIPEVNAAWHQALQELGLEVKNPTENYPSEKDAPNDFTKGEPETKERLGNDSRKRHITVENELSPGMRKNSNDPVTSCRREPIGIGTFYTESLTSFVSRLACAHGMSVSDFVIELLASSEGGLFLLSRKNGHSLSDLWKDAAGLN